MVIWFGSVGFILGTLIGTTGSNSLLDLNSFLRGYLIHCAEGYHTGLTTTNGVNSFNPRHNPYDFHRWILQRSTELSPTVFIRLQVIR
ncbi:hypothetical protein D3C73_1564630 [compost metagenome]